MNNSEIEVIQRYIPAVVNSVRLDTETIPHIGDAVLNISSELAKIKPIVDNWKPKTEYKVGQLVLFDDKLYSSLDNFTSESSFDYNKFLDLSPSLSGVEQASETVSGISKLYTSLGENEDGSIVQKTISENIQNLTDSISSFNTSLDSIRDSLNDVNTKLRNLDYETEQHINSGKLTFSSTSLYPLQNIFDSREYKDLSFYFYLSPETTPSNTGIQCVSLMQGDTKISNDSCNMSLQESKNSSASTSSSITSSVNGAYSPRFLFPNPVSLSASKDVKYFIEAHLQRIDDAEESFSSNVKWALYQKSGTISKGFTCNYGANVDIIIEGRGFVPDFDGFSFQQNFTNSSLYFLIKGIKL